MFLFATGPYAGGGVRGLGEGEEVVAGGVRMHPLAGQIISKSCSFPLILASESVLLFAAGPYAGGGWDKNPFV